MILECSFPLKSNGVTAVLTAQSEGLENFVRDVYKKVFSCLSLTGSYHCGFVIFRIKVL